MKFTQLIYCSILIFQMEHDTFSPEDMSSTRSLVDLFITKSSNDSLNDAVWHAQAALLLAARPMQTLCAQLRAEETAWRARERWKLVALLCDRLLLLVFVGALAVGSLSIVLDALSNYELKNELGPAPIE